MDKSEQQIQSDILDYMKGKGIWVFKVVTANRAGIPDIVGCTPEGRFIAVEVKKPGKKLSALQLYNQELLKRNDGIYIVATSVADCKRVLELTETF